MKKNNTSILRLRLSVFLIVTLCVNSACKKKDNVQKDNAQKEEMKEVPSLDKIVDLALIYHGGEHRLNWNSSQLKHYVYREMDGDIQWLYDGFLFLEFISTINGRKVDFEYDGLRGGKGATKAEWVWLLNKTFAVDRGPDAVEKTLDSLAKKGKNPLFKRKAVFALPLPIYDLSDWGSIDHKVLDMKKSSDRAFAVNWYIDRILAKWKEKDYKHLEFGGFYWLHEAVIDKHQDREVIKIVKENLETKKLPLSWIPYYGAEGSPYWKEIGFDIAYQQPNYFFETHTPMEILTGAIGFAERNGLNLEMEYDGRVEEPAFRERFYAYLNEFEKGNVWNTQPVAYYDGGGAWYNLSISKDPEMRKMAKALGDILVKRQNKAALILTTK